MSDESRKAYNNGELDDTSQRLPIYSHRGFLVGSLIGRMLQRSQNRPSWYRPRRDGREWGPSIDAEAFFVNMRRFDLILVHDVFSGCNITISRKHFYLHGHMEMEKPEWGQQVYVEMQHWLCDDIERWRAMYGKPTSPWAGNAEPQAYGYTTLMRQFEEKQEDRLEKAIASRMDKNGVREVEVATDPISDILRSRGIDPPHEHDTPVRNLESGDGFNESSNGTESPMNRHAVTTPATEDSPASIMVTDVGREPDRSMPLSMETMRGSELTPGIMTTVSMTGRLTARERFTDPPHLPPLTFLIGDEPYKAGAYKHAKKFPAKIDIWESTVWNVLDQNPYAPDNMLQDRVSEALAALEIDNNFRRMFKLMLLLRHPYTWGRLLDIRDAHLQPPTDQTATMQF